MVTVVNFDKRINEEQKEFFTLTLEGDVELAQSSKTGNFYATARKTTITSTFNEATCKRLIGKTLPGTIQKLECDPYEYVDKETGEVIELSHKYVYNPNGNSTMEEAVFEKELIAG